MNYTKEIKIDKCDYDCQFHSNSTLIKYCDHPYFREENPILSTGNKINNFPDFCPLLKFDTTITTIVRIDI